MAKKKVEYSATCPTCGEEFRYVLIRKHRTYCSRTCANRARKPKPKLPCEKCGVRASRTKGKCQRCYWRAVTDERRNQVLKKYGGACRCCGITEPRWLSIEHRDQNGSEERKRNPQFVGSSRYYTLAREPKRDDLELACFNCQMAVYWHGWCPHRSADYPLIRYAQRTWSDWETWVGELWLVAKDIWERVKVKPKWQSARWPLIHTELEKIRRRVLREGRQSGTISLEDIHEPTDSDRNRR